MATASRQTASIPPLRTGDHLTVKEFERRYRAMPHVKKAELIEGVVYMPSPVSDEYHGTPHAHLVTWAGVYTAHTPGTQPGDNSTLLLEKGENQPQPDVLLRILPEYGGQSRHDNKGYILGAPELAAEVSASRVSYDLHAKKDAYERNGVREYVVWRVEEAAIDWFVLRGGRYHALRRRDGVFRSKVFPGLWLDAPALLAGDLARVLAVVQEGVASPEHRRFVARLAKKYHREEERRNS